MHKDIQRSRDPRVILLATSLDDDPAIMLYAVAEARRSGARLLLVHVVPPPSEAARAGPNLPKAFVRPRICTAADALDHVALRLRWQGILCEPIVLRGNPAEQIASLVHSRGVERVIVGTSGGRPPGHALENSTAANLLTSLDVPVCVVGRNVYPGMFTDHGPDRVLLALSLNSYSRGYVDFACGLAEACRARLSLLHVLDNGGLSEDQREQRHHAARMRLAALAATQSRLWRQPEIAVRQGDTVSQILEEAVYPNRDLIILGSSSARTGPRASEDSVVHRVISEARCPVMILQPPAAVSAQPVIEASELRTGSLN
jgi:nucleotide-binding universal stress UspA family protein